MIKGNYKISTFYSLKGYYFGISSKFFGKNRAYYYKFYDLDEYKEYFTP